VRRPKSLAGWVRRHRQSIDAVIRAARPNVGPLNDEDREDWINNDEGLYLWAKREGVPL